MQQPVLPLAQRAGCRMPDALQRAVPWLRPALRRSATVQKNSVGYNQQAVQLQ